MMMLDCNQGIELQYERYGAAEFKMGSKGWNLKDSRAIGLNQIRRMFALNANKHHNHLHLD
jgi:hypothetical protein